MRGTCPASAGAIMAAGPFLGEFSLTKEGSFGQTKEVTKASQDKKTPPLKKLFKTFNYKTTRNPNKKTMRSLPSQNKFWCRITTTLPFNHSKNND
jgi:hypothetical protein